MKLMISLLLIFSIYASSSSTASLSSVSSTSIPTFVTLLIYLSVILISIIPLPILYFINIKPNSNYSRLLIAFAIGTLLGDVFLHLLPHASEKHVEGHNHGNIGHMHTHTFKKNLNTDIAKDLLNKIKNNKINNIISNNDKINIDNDKLNTGNINNINNKKKSCHNHQHHSHDHHAHDNSIGYLILLGIISFFTIEKVIPLFLSNHTHNHNNHKKDDDISESEHNDEYLEKQKLSFRVLQCIADATHNFSDGMFLAASFLSAYRAYISIHSSEVFNLNCTFFTAAYLTRPLTDTLVILIHEIPHEIGDFAMQIQGGASKPAAILVQLLTAVGALVGAATVLLIGSVFNIEEFILPFTCGGFLYIALVGMVPQLLVENNFLQTVFQLFAMGAGIGIMHLIGILEHM